MTSPLCPGHLALCHSVLNAELDTDGTLPSVTNRRDVVSHLKEQSSLIPDH